MLRFPENGDRRPAAPGGLEIAPGTYTFADTWPACDFRRFPAVSEDPAPVSGSCSAGAVTSYIRPADQRIKQVGFQLARTEETDRFPRPGWF